MAAPRAIRIVRRPAPGPEPRVDEGTPTREARPVVAEPSAAYRPNRAGSERGLRLFMVFSLALLVIYLISVGAAAAGPAGLAASAGALAVYSVIAVVFALVAWMLTLGRAPREASVGPTEVTVRERLGRVRRFAGIETLRVEVTQRYPRGWLSSEPTELVRLSEAGGRSRMYLVTEGLFQSEPSGR